MSYEQSPSPSSKRATQESEVYAAVPDASVYSSIPDTLTGPTGSAANRRTIAAWSLWDFGSNAFNTVMWSFVFSVYVTTAAAPDKETGQLIWANAQTIAGIALALLAPLMGAWADRVRNRRLMLTVSTLIVVAAMAACFFVMPQAKGDPSITYLLLGTGLLAFASVVQDIAGVFYNGMLLQISTPKTVGRISGTAWGMGYLGGVICLLVALFGFVQGGPYGTGLLAISGDHALNYRAIAVFCAVFLLIFSVPVMVWGPPPDTTVAREGRFTIQGAYRAIIGRLLHMWSNERKLLHFLVASGIYRDGLNAVFAFAGTIAASVYGFEPAEVIIFGLAANAIAAVGTWLFGRIDDWLGPHRVVIISLSAMIAAGLVVVIAQDKTVFWVGGMVISSMVGAVQSASRTLLTRIIPAGEENETFGLYATVGRVVSFIAPALVSLFTAIWGASLGMLGIVATLALGLLLFWPLRIDGVTHQRVRQEPTGLVHT